MTACHATCSPSGKDALTTEQNPGQDTGPWVPDTRGWWRRQLQPLLERPGEAQASQATRASEEGTTRL